MSNKDPEKRRVYCAAYHAAHHDKIRAYHAAYNAAHREERRAYDAAYRHEHREDHRTYLTAWYAAHREECLAKSRAYRIAHPEVHRAVQHKRYALKRQIREVGPDRVLARAEWDKIVRLSKGRCFYCKRKRKLTQDHVIPLSKGGLHVAENVVAACMPCNARKQVKVVTLF